jgi:predicted  nucleic acid-binding Zn-ribbon protein
LEPTVSYTQQLHQLQQMDSQIDALSARLEEIAASLTESPALKSAKAAFSQADATYRRLKATMTDLELEVKGLQQKIAQHEERLYSGKVTNPKEASAMQDEVAASKRWLARREEDLLEVMIQYDEVEATYLAGQDVLAQVQTQWEADQSDLLAEQAKKQGALKTLTRSRAALTQLIERSDLADYERARRKLGGVGLAEVEDGLCLACRVMLSSRMVQMALMENRLYYCDSCGRIIHIL